MPNTVHLYVFDTLADWEPGFVVAGINNPDGQTSLSAAIGSGPWLSPAIR